MIQFNGYYSIAPEYYKDSIANYVSEGYMHFAYRFFINGIVTRRSKSSKNKIEIFNEDDFNKSRTGEYKILGNKLEIIFDRGKRWEYREVFVIESENKFINADKVFKFNKWI